MVAAVVSEARVPVAPYQQVPGQDLTAMGTLAQGSTDNVVGNLLYSGTVYTGMSAKQVGTSNIVAVQPGYLVKGGPAYSLRDVFEVDVSAAINSVPDSSKSLIVCIVADGQEFSSDERRTFVDASRLPTDPTQPGVAVTMATPIRVTRSVVISSPRGTADVQPSPPAYSAALALIATVVVSNTGIVSVTQGTDAQVTTQEQMAATLATVSAYVGTLDGIIRGLLSGVAANALAISLLRAQEQADVASLQRQLDQLRITSTTPAASTFTGVDYFLDLSQSLPAAPGYNALVSGGLRFPNAGKADVPIAPQNPYSGSLQQGAGNYLFPAYNIAPNSYMYVGALYYDLGKGNGVKVGNLGTFSGPVYRRDFARARIRSSFGLKATSPAQVLANGDPSQLFAIDPTTFVYDSVNWGDWKTTTTEIVRQNGYWSDLSARDFWSPIVGTGDVGGLPVVTQPLTPQTSFMAARVVAHTFGGAASGATVRLLIVADKAGVPDFTRCYADVTTQTTGNGVADGAVFNLPYPLLQKAGVTYHYAFTASDPNLQFVTGPFGGNAAGAAIGSASFLTYGNGAWAAPSAGTRLGVSVYPPNFYGSTTVTLDLAPLQLAGGGDTVDFQFSLLLPEGCTVTPQIYVGGQWVSLAAVLNSTYPLAGNPSNVPARLVLTGTGRVVPVINTAASTSRISKASAALEHVSAIQTPAAPVTTVHKTVVVDNWNPAVQTLTANLRTGAGYATVTPGVQQPDTFQTDGALLRKWTWTLPTAVPSFEMEIDGVTNDNTQQFVVRRSNWDAAA